MRLFRRGRIKVTDIVNGIIKIALPKLGADSLIGDGLRRLAGRLRSRLAGSERQIEEEKQQGEKRREDIK